jgi:hypothetical protein
MSAGRTLDKEEAKPIHRRHKDYGRKYSVAEKKNFGRDLEELGAETN